MPSLLPPPAAGPRQKKQKRNDRAGDESFAKIPADGAQRVHPGLRRAKPVRGGLPGAQAHLPGLAVLQVPLLRLGVPAVREGERVRHVRAQPDRGGDAWASHHELGRREALIEFKLFFFCFFRFLSLRLALSVPHTQRKDGGFHARFFLQHGRGGVCVCVVWFSLKPQG